MWRKGVSPIDGRTWFYATIQGDDFDGSMMVILLEMVFMVKVMVFVVKVMVFMVKVMVITSRSRVRCLDFWFSLFP